MAEQKVAIDELQRTIITNTASVPLLWHNRIVAHSAVVKGWKVTPSSYVGQDLAEVWIDQ